MADKKLKLKIITPSKILVDTEVDAVFSRSTEGNFGILPDHAPFMTPLDIGVTKYKKGNDEIFVSVIEGIFQVSNNNVTILSQTAECGSEIDLTRANAAKERAEARLQKAALDVDVHRAEIALSRAIARIKAASRQGL